MSENKRKKESLHGLLAGIIFWFVLWGITKIYGESLCPIKNLFGISCPGCGLTRGFICILKLDFYGAYRYNVLSIPLFVAISAYALLIISDLIFHKSNTEKADNFLGRKYMYLIYILVLCLSVYLNHKIV